MDYKEIKRLIEDMGESKIDSLDIEFPDGVKISMKKNNKEVVSNVIPASAPMTVPVVQNNTENSLMKTENNIGKVNDSEANNLKEIKSPMVGTFYRSSSPTSEPFVKVGDKIKKGQVVCIIEAMKLMNEIESEYDGEVVEICVENEQMVEYGKTLFKIK